MYTIEATGSTYFLKANGSDDHIRVQPGGSQQWSIEGHYVRLRFPTDQPAGPWTTQCIGRATFSVDSSNTFSNLKSVGRQVGICAA